MSGRLVRGAAVFLCLAAALAAGGPPLGVLRRISLAQAQSAGCTFQLGFQTLRALVGPARVGDCLEDERHNPANGNTEQRTTGGLLVWRKADNWTAFTDGFRTWLNGPSGLQVRLNAERFLWEADFGSAAPAVLAAGDIAGCDPEGLQRAESTALLLDRSMRSNVTVAPLGDLAYENGSDAEFAHCYHPTWGRHRAQTRPAPGNHEYHTPGAAGYYRYFGAAAGEPDKGYYSYDIGGWHVVVLNSNCAAVGGCAAGSPQERWLRADLAARPAACTLAYMHEPLFTSGPHGPSEYLRPLWQALYDARVDVVLTAHDHHYERFAPQDPAGRLDAERGLRAFVVGTGGAPMRQIGRRLPNSEAASLAAHGVLKLLLGVDGYAWEFPPNTGGPPLDAGTTRCG